MNTALILAILCGQVPVPATIAFNRDVRPILAENCYFCHGPDKNKREADLRLDTKAGLFDPAPPHDGKQKLVPVKPGVLAESEVWRRVTSDDPDQKMPPASSTKSLSARDLAVLKKWVEQGAPWEGHWAFQPVKRSALPDGASTIDRLLGASLQSQGLSPSPLADPITLIRRVHFDLTGLPPTPEEVDAYVRDPSVAAYTAVVDRLVASPEYGERMAMWWLDLVRYADTVGYHGDQPVEVAPFREYVIKSFQTNKRFDQFTREQFAGDLLPEPTLAQQVAAGYNRLGMMSAEGGVQPKEYLAKYIAERVRNASGAWLGVTLGCAECHDHKFDPFTTQDFYRFEAFFADIQEQGLYGGDNFGPQMQVPTPPQAEQQKQLTDRVAQLRTTTKTVTPELAAAQIDWEKAQPTWTLLKPTSMTSVNGATLTMQDDGSILVSGTSPPTDTYQLQIPEIPGGMSGLRIEVLPHDSLPAKGPGRAGNGNFVLTELTARGSEAQPVAWKNAVASHEQTSQSEGNPYKKWAAAAAIDGDAQGAKWGWGILDQVGKTNQAAFETREPLAAPSSPITIELQQNHGDQHTLGRFRLWVAATSPAFQSASLPPLAITTVLMIPTAERQEPQKVALTDFPVICGMAVGALGH